MPTYCFDLPATWIPRKHHVGFFFFFWEWISKLCRSNIFLFLPSEFKSETIKSSILQLLHGCTSQSLRTSDNKQLVHFSPPHQDLSFPRRHLYSHHSSHDLSSHLSACIWVGYWDVSLFILHRFNMETYGRRRGPKNITCRIYFSLSERKVWFKILNDILISQWKRGFKGGKKVQNNDRPIHLLLYVMVFPLQPIHRQKPRPEQSKHVTFLRPC